MYVWKREKKDRGFFLLKNKHVFYGKQEVGLISGCISGCLPWIPLWNLASGGSKISEKNTFSGFRFAILPPAGQRSQKKHVPEKNTHI